LPRAARARENEQRKTNRETRGSAAASNFDSKLCEARKGWCGLIRTSPYPLAPIASDRNS